ncbi:hypothetical protein IAR55_000645 [Kwoniella newhampshirensis]|uniref:Mesaconyl-C4 CoA hydratase n=1 Tax=Kwoniella newhampshirensis TaxID=1651941 RepID=A0AAW0Z808_9TREE
MMKTPTMRSLRYLYTCRASLRSYTTSSTPSLQTWMEALTSKPPEITHDVIDTERASQLARILPTCQDTSEALKDDLPNGEVLSKGHHLVYFRPKFMLNDLGRDGSSTEYNAPPPFTRRMWAGGSMFWSSRHHLRIGERVTQAVSVPKVEHKKGMVFVYQKRVIYPATRSNGDLDYDEDEWAVKELRTHVFRQAEAVPVSAGPSSPSSASSGTIGRQSHFSFTYTPSSPLLFLFSALTHNPHKVHYDQSWTTTQEGHRAPLVHGPMSALLLIELAGRVGAHKTLKRFDYRATSPMVVGEEIGMRETWAEEGDLQLTTEQSGKVGMRAVARYAAETWYAFMSREHYESDIAYLFCPETGLVVTR